MPNSFTPQQIEDFLQEFFDVVGARQYTGARYVPIFGRAGSDTVEWDDTAPYEPLTVVMHQGVSYVSRRYVPTGIQVTDNDYWVETYRFNAQVEQYRQEVLQFQGQIDQIRETMEADYVPFPDPDSYPKYGLLGQVLSTLADGATEWVDPVTVTADVAEPLIEDWLDTHPEATTTVQDGSITDAKLSDGSSIVRFRGAVPGSVTALSDVRNGGIYNVAAAVVQALTDKPTGAPNASMLLLNLTYATPYGNQYPVQVAVSLYGTLMMWWRVVGTESATDWMTLYPLSVGTSDIVDGSITDPKLADASTVVRNRGTVDASVTSIASVTSPGTYYIPQAVFAEMTDKPTGAGNNSFTLVNVPYLIIGGATYVYQLLFIGHDSLNELYMRYTGAGGASAWVNLRNPVILDGTITDPKLADVSTVVRFRGWVDASVTSIAAVTSPGTYYVPQAVFTAMTDKPAGAGNNTFTLVNVPYLVSGSNTFVYQILFIGHDSLNELYMRFTNYNGVTAWVNLRNPVIPNNTVTPAKLTFSPNALTGKKLVTAGDSYTAALFGSTSPDTGHNFGYWIAQRNAMTFVNSGISGSTMALSKSYVDDPDNVDIDTNHPFSYQRYLQVPSDTDYLTLWFGINDTYATYLGTIDDTDNTTFYGAWNKVLEYYLTNRPYMHVGIVVTVNAGSSYEQAVREVAAKWGYPVLDLVKGTDTPAFFQREGMSTAACDLRRDAYGWNTWNQHPNVQWHQFISSAFEEFLKRC